MNRILKRLTAAIVVGAFATAVIMSCAQKPSEAAEAADANAEAKKDSTEHPAGEHPAGEHPSDSSEHPADSTKKN